TWSAVGSIAVMNKFSKKKDREAALNFYCFQKKEAQRNAKKQGPKTRFRRNSLPGDFGAVYKDTAQSHDLTSLFEHFLIAGIHPNANLGHVEDAFTSKKKWGANLIKLM
ncbi:hypothetical protein Tco_1350581, partial [Tanacetum coccineum]